MNLWSLQNRNLIFEGDKPLTIKFNRPVIGNPGTGKTTFAKLYGQLLKHLNFLSNGESVYVTGSDLVGSVVGESQQKAKDVLEKAKGKILVIDEAYILDDGLYGKQVFILKLP